MLGFHRQTNRECLKSVLPTTMNFGEAGMAELSRRLTQVGGIARTAVFDGLGHFGPMEDPERVAASMTSAFASRSASP